MLKYIIGTVSELDTPLTPSMKGQRSMAAWISGVTESMIQKERDEVLNCTVEDIQKLSEYVQAMLEDEIICVLGNESNLKKEEQIFGSLESLFQA